MGLRAPIPRIRVLPFLYRLLIALTNILASSRQLDYRQLLLVVLLESSMDGLEDLRLFDSESLDICRKVGFQRLYTRTSMVMPTGDHIGKLQTY